MIRILLILKQGLREIHRLIHPNALIPIKIGHTSVSGRVVEAVWGFFAVYVIAYLSMCMLLLATGLDFVTSSPSVLAGIDGFITGFAGTAGFITGFEGTDGFIIGLAGTDGFAAFQHQMVNFTKVKAQAIDDPLRHRRTLSGGFRRIVGMIICQVGHV